MTDARRPALAWRNVTESRLRLIASVAGCAFAVVLMFMENGFKKALLDSMVAVISRLDGDVVVVSKARYILAVQQAFPLRRVTQARGVPGVASAHPVYVEGREGKWRNVTDGLRRRIRVIAFRPDDDLLSIPEVRSQLDKLKLPETALGDTRSKSDLFGPFADLPESEVGNRRIRVMGTFPLGSDFQNDGNLIVSEQTFLELFPTRMGGGLGDTLVDVGLIRSASGVSATELRDRLRAMLPDDVDVYTKQEFMEKERDFWARITPIGIVFNIGVVMGFVVGTAICYQILFADISDRMAEFATLKAIGYSSRTLRRVVIEQAVLLALMGYLAGMTTSFFLYRWVGAMTGLPLHLSVTDAVFFLVVTLAMCGVSGLLASRKLFAADPAELFR